MTDGTVDAENLLPYSSWTEEALRGVVIEALSYAEANGLPGEHHFYITFGTDYPGVSIPAHLRAKYPQEMTIVLQHRFWDLKMDRTAMRFGVGLSFGGIPAQLSIPIAAITGFADPHVQFGLRFQPPANVAPLAEEEPEGAEENEEPPPLADAAGAEPASGRGNGPSQVVSLDAFRRRPRD